jgi:hypothetical protein
MRTTEEIYAELATCIGAMHYDADDAIFRVLAARVDELLRERCRVLGLPEDGSIEEDDIDELRWFVANEVKRREQM